METKEVTIELDGKPVKVLIGEYTFWEMFQAKKKAADQIKMNLKTKQMSNEVKGSTGLELILGRLRAGIKQLPDGITMDDVLKKGKNKDIERLYQEIVELNSAGVDKKKLQEPSGEVEQT